MGLKVTKVYTYEYQIFDRTGQLIANGRKIAKSNEDMEKWLLEEAVKRQVAFPRFEYSAINHSDRHE